IMWRFSVVVPSVCFAFFSYCSRPLRALHSFPTRRSSDLFTDAQLPVWIDNSRRGEHFYYGIPGNHWRGFKIADDTRGPVVDPTTMERQISAAGLRSEEHTSELQSRFDLVCRLLLEKKKKKI